MSSKINTILILATALFLSACGAAEEPTQGPAAEVEYQPVEEPAAEKVEVPSENPPLETKAG